MAFFILISNLYRYKNSFLLIELNEFKAGEMRNGVGNMTVAMSPIAKTW